MWICTAFNYRQFVAKMIRALYFQDNSKDEKNEGLISIKPIKFNFREKFYDLLPLEWFRFCC